MRVSQLATSLRVPLMHAHNSTLVLVLYLMIAAVVVLAGRVVYLQTEQKAARLVAAGPQLERPASAAAAPRRNQGVSTYALARANQQLESLKSALADSTQLLQKRTSLLQAKNAECRRLEEELEESIEFVFAVNSQAKPKVEPARDVELQLKALRSELNSTAAARREQVNELEELRAALIDAEMRLAELQEEAAQEFALLARDREVLLTAVGDSMADLGEDVVQTLVDLLRHQSPTVRAWSASVLGKIGPDASAAAGTLTDLIADSDSVVREEARRALAALEG